jgi:hypothetical protein
VCVFYVRERKRERVCVKCGRVCLKKERERGVFIFGASCGKTEKNVCLLRCSSQKAIIFLSLIFVITFSFDKR